GTPAFERPAFRPPGPVTPAGQDPRAAELCGLGVPEQLANLLFAHAAPLVRRRCRSTVQAREALRLAWRIFAHKKHFRMLLASAEAAGHHTAGPPPSAVIRKRSRLHLRRFRLVATRVVHLDSPMSTVARRPVSRLIVATVQRPYRRHQPEAR